MLNPLTTVSLLYIFLPLLFRLLRLFVKRVLLRSLDPLSCGKWAVITGATAGIGKAFARALAERGMDVVLVGRSRIKLEEVGKDIEEEFGVKTKMVAVDFTEDEFTYLDRYACWSMTLQSGYVSGAVPALRF